MNLFVEYCNLGGHPELIEMLQRAIDAPTAAFKSAAKRGSLTGPIPGMGTETDASSQQRIKSTAWTLGVSVKE